MKITLAYIDEEQEAATAVVAALQRLQLGAKVRESDRHAPFKHIYVTTRIPQNPRNTNEND